MKPRGAEGREITVGTRAASKLLVAVAATEPATR
jgi:hypothetical protein